MKEKPNMNSASAQELDKIEKQFDDFAEKVSQTTFDQLNKAPKQEQESTKPLSQLEIANSKDIYLKPYRTVGCQDKFNEDYREEYNFAKEYVQFQADNKEIVGESIDIWTRPFAGLPAEWWKVPVNKPLWGPRYLAEQIKRCYYHRLVMAPHTQMGSDGFAQYHGSISVDTTVQRLDAIPVSSRRSVFMGSTNF
jgi:hypothetical protein